MKLDPSFALAHAGMAHVWGGLHELRNENPDYLVKGLEACAKAESLNPDLPEVLSARALIRVRAGRIMTRRFDWR